jgi:cbb3-type cytochrome oxidase subunit 1
VPRVSVWFVRASLVHLMLGITLGALLLAEKGLEFGPGLWRLRPAHVEILLFGWVVQLVLGVAVWIFPRLGLGRTARGGETLQWSAFALLNGAVVVVAVAGATGGSLGLGLAGRIAELIAVGLLIAGLWRRARPGLSEM